MAESAVLDLQRGCDLACGFCHVRAADPGTAAQRGDQAAAAARQALGQGARDFVLTGGEPSLEPWLPSLVAGLRKAGAQVTLETHGCLAPQLIERLARAGLNRAVVACNSLDPRTVDAMARRIGTWPRLQAGVQGLLQAGIAVDLTAVVLPENRDHLADLRQRAGEIWPATQAALGRLWLRPLTMRADRGPLLPIDHLALVLGEVAQQPGLALAMTPGFELPPCAYADPTALTPLLRLSAALVNRESQRYRRLPACATCAAAAQCPGALPAYADALHAAQALTHVPGNAGSDTLSDALLPPHQALQLSIHHRLDPRTLAQHAAELPLEAPPPWQPPEPTVFDREAWELDQGWRQGLRREVASAEAAAQVASDLQSRGLHTAIDGGAPGHTLAAPNWLVWAARDAQALAHAAQVDRLLADSLRHGQRAAARTAIADLGRWLGYPDCCVAAFAAEADSGDARLVQSLANQQLLALRPEQNWAVVPLRWMSYLPCRPQCAATAQRAAAVRLHVEQHHPLWAEQSLAVLRSPVVAWSYERFALFLGGRVLEPGVIAYEQLVGLDHFADAGHLLGRRSWRMFAAEILAPLRLGNRLSHRGRHWQVHRDGEIVAELEFEEPGPRVLRFDGG